MKRILSPEQRYPSPLGAENGHSDDSTICESPGYAAGFGPEPIAVFGELEKIVNQRYYYCEGCTWHPDVCVHCVRSLED